RWHPPLLTAAAVGLVTGLALASRDPRSQADALLIVGGLVAAAGLVTRRAAVVGAGAVIVSLAVGSHLELSHVRATDAYLAPVAALLLGAGFHLRRTGDGTGGDAPSSWVAYTPAVVLLGRAASRRRRGRAVQLTGPGGPALPGRGGGVGHHPLTGGVDRAAGTVGHVAGEDVRPVGFQLDREGGPSAGAERAGEGHVVGRR